LEIEQFDIFKEILLNLESLKSAPGTLVTRPIILLANRFSYYIFPTGQRNGIPIGPKVCA